MGLVGLYAECDDGTKKSDECSGKIAGVAERYGVKVKESSVGSIGFVGGVKRPEAKSTDNGKMTVRDQP